MTNVENTPEERGTVITERGTNLAIKRLAISAERTLMAWIRTAISMIGFGFTIFKFFQYMYEESPAALIRHAETPRNLGMTLVALGTLALAVAVWQHRVFLKDIGESQPLNAWTISFVVAIVVVLIGVLTFCGVLLRIGPY
jgi:putative membrane protein